MSDQWQFPAGPTAVQALEFARETEHPAILNHSLRTYLHAERAAARRSMRAGLDYEQDLLFYACLLHDMGASDRFDGDQRFEVEGADAAAGFLVEHGVDESRAEQVWQAIALHTSPGIVERRGPVPVLTRLGVQADFGSGAELTEAEVAQLERTYPRLRIEHVLAGIVVQQAVRNPAKAPASSWPGGMLRAHLAEETAPDGLNAAF